MNLQAEIFKTHNGEIKEDLSGNLQATWLYEYDDNQNLTQRSVDTGDGTPFVQLINTYDENGNPSKVIKIFDSGEETLLGEYVYKQYTVKVK